MAEEIHVDMSKVRGYKLEVLPRGRKPNWGNYPPIAYDLYREGLLLGLPAELDRPELTVTRDPGRDIVYRFKGMTPAVFKEHKEDILLLARLTLDKYKREWEDRYATITIRYYPPGEKRSRLRGFTAARHDNPEVLVYGEEALGYTLPEGVPKPFLVDKVEEIIELPTKGVSPKWKPLKRRIPYRVVELRLALRNYKKAWKK
jgi:hypothetical protein